MTTIHGNGLSSGHYLHHKPAGEVGVNVATVVGEGGDTGGYG